MVRTPSRRNGCLIEIKNPPRAILAWQRLHRMDELTMDRSYQRKNSRARKKKVVQTSHNMRLDKSVQLVANRHLDKSVQHATIANLDFAAREKCRQTLNQLRDEERAEKVKKAKTDRGREIANLCAKYRVSRSAIYWHLKRGTMPSLDRHFNENGSYPKSRSVYSDRTFAYSELKHAFWALTRADKKACDGRPWPYGANKDDFAVLQEILELAKDMIVRWEGVL
jgi:hypothetical protein